MAHGGSRPNTGPKKKKVSIPVELLSPSVATALGASPSPAPSVPPTLISEDQILAKLTELALAGNPLCLRLALEQRERGAKVELLKEQTRNLKLRNQALKNHLEREGLPVDDADEYEPSEDPVQLAPALKMVSK